MSKDSGSNLAVNAEHSRNIGPTNRMSNTNGENNGHIFRSEKERNLVGTYCATREKIKNRITEMLLQHSPTGSCYNLH